MTRLLEKPKNFWKRYHNIGTILILILSIWFTFLYINIIFSLKILFNYTSDNYGLFRIFIIAISLVILMMIFLSNDITRMRVMANQYGVAKLMVVLIASILFFISYMLSAYTNNYMLILIFDVKKGFDGMISIIISIVASWFAFAKKAQVLVVNVITDNDTYKNGILSVAADETCRLRALCKGDNEDIIEFVGFCVNEDLDTILNSAKSKKASQILQPKYNCGCKFYGKKEIIEPHKLSPENILQGKDIWDAIPDSKKQEGSYVLIDFLYRDSSDNYFYAQVNVKKP